MYKLERPGITLQLKNKDGEEIVIGRDGEVGSLGANCSVKFVVAPTEPNVWLVDVDGKKSVIIRKPDTDTQIYTTSIHIWEAGKSGVACTRYPENHVRVLRYMGDGSLDMWEVALVSQDGKFWATCQKSYSFSVARKGDQFLCPQFAEKWPQLVKVLEILLGVKNLPAEVAGQCDEPTCEVTGLAKNAGRVKWYNCAQQMGVLTTNRGDVRVHWSQIISKNGSRRVLFPGQTAIFCELRSIVVKEGQRPTGFTHEAIGVKPL